MRLHECVTHWLVEWGEGDDAAIERVTEAVYTDLKRLAARYLDGEQGGHTLQTTALVHEAYLRISSIRDVPWKGRGQFIGLVARMMRRILIDHARRRNSSKRTADAAAEAGAAVHQGLKIDVLAVDQALSRMQSDYPRAAQVVELHFFGGLEMSEAAEVLEISLATAERDWRFAKAWLQKRMGSR